MRVAKAMAHAGLCSRRDAEKWIEAGRVAVNGAVLTTPAHVVTAADVVTVDGEPLPAPQVPRLWRYHKPKGLVTSHKDPEGRPTVFATLPDTLPRVVSVGRLDINTEGLLLLTTNGALARHLELPSTGWKRRYRVRAHGYVTQDSLDRLKRGVTVDGVRYGPVEARIERQQGGNSWLTIALKEGKNREVKHIAEHLGLTVNRLIRVSFGPVALGNLPTGAVEEVKRKVLVDQLGVTLSRELGLKS
jgi:23S rRNA pseudouridine2605 synthase